MDPWSVNPRVSREEIIGAVCRECDCGEEEILAKGRKRNTARDVAMLLSRDHTGMSCRDPGRTSVGYRDLRFPTGVMF